MCLRCVPSRRVVLYIVFMVFPLSQTLVKTLAKKLFRSGTEHITPKHITSYNSFGGLGDLYASEGGFGGGKSSDKATAATTEKATPRSM